MSMTVCQLSNAGSSASCEPLSPLIYYKADTLSKAQCRPIEHLTMNIFPLLLLVLASSVHGCTKWDSCKEPEHYCYQVRFNIFSCLDVEVLSYLALLLTGKIHLINDIIKVG